jgi:hypothetical protein
MAGRIDGVLSELTFPSAALLFLLVWPTSYRLILLMREIEIK